MEPKEGQYWFTASHVLHPLTKSCTIGVDVQKNITAPQASVGEVPCHHIGIGNDGIWRGSPDAMCRVVPVKAIRNEEKDKSDSSTCSARVMCEAKIAFADTDLMQLCGQSVVAFEESSPTTAIIGPSNRSCKRRSYGYIV